MKIEYNPIIELLTLYLKQLDKLSKKEKETIMDTLKKILMATILRPKNLSEVERLKYLLTNIDDGKHVMYITEEK